MRWKTNWYLAHRWLGLVVGLQLLAWSVGGFAFSIMQIENVRGELDVKPSLDLPLDFAAVRISPGDAVDRAAQRGIDRSTISSVTLRERHGSIAYEMFDSDGAPLASVDAATGGVRLRLSEAEARAAALADFKHDTTIESVKLIEGEPPIEFRGGQMPVYQVILDHPQAPHIYVCPVTGEVLKRRNQLWRVFDFFWMLHIMDYGERDNFNHWLLTGMSALAIMTSSSGLALWWWRRPRWMRRSQPQRGL